MEGQEDQWIVPPFFKGWMEQKVKKYIEANPELTEDPSKPLLRGYAPSEDKPFSIAKYTTALLSVIYGPRKLGARKFMLSDIAKYLEASGYGISEGLVRLWRNEKRFRDTVSRLRKEYASYYVHSLYRVEGDLRSRTELQLEILHYPVELESLVEEYSANVDAQLHEALARGLEDVRAAIGEDRFKEEFREYNPLLPETGMKLLVRADKSSLMPALLLGCYVPTLEMTSGRAKKAKKKLLEHNFQALLEVILQEVNKIPKKKNELSVEDIDYAIRFICDQLLYLLRG